MLSQYQVNEACYMLKRDGQEITIAKVRKLLDKHYSFFDVADKVLLYKEDATKAEKAAKEESVQSPEKTVLGLGSVIDKVLLSCALHEHKEVAINLKEKLQDYIDQEIRSKVHKYEHEIRKLRQKNDHLEVSYYGYKTRFEQLMQEQTLLKEQNYMLQQQLQKAQVVKNHRVTEEVQQQKPAQVRDYQIQMKLLNAELCAVYDVQKQRIVVKMPPNHQLKWEFQKGMHGRYLHANAVYEFGTKFWFLSQFEAETINLLVRNKFVISKELADVLQKLQG
ncbi:MULTISPECIES: hypothetical protein [Cysteiniphilum]|uniref:hypothetical protein n=1 Tax=Cysteiniphilum TaxID=2056696 RepID=UPI00177C0E13|nr:MULTISPECIES: hypothetical protein [Cysteiniphilum]